jgi:hypothetical protein
MSESDTSTSSTPAAGIDPPTEEIFVPTTGVGTGAATSPGHSGAQPGDENGSGDDEWPDRGPLKGFRMSVPTVVLLGLLIAAGGIWGGAALQRSQGTSSGTSSAISSLASLFRGRGTTGAGAFTGGAGAFGSSAATGTVTEVTGSTLYVTNASGDLVKVTVGPSVTVTRDAASSLGALQVGDTVVVQGTKASNGTVTASSVAATGAGVTSRFGAGALAAGG